MRPVIDCIRNHKKSSVMNFTVAMRLPSAEAVWRHCRVGEEYAADEAGHPFHF
jgi:hypothetical protein